VGQNILAGTYKKKNSYNFFISPGMALGNDSVAYAKVGYAGSKIAADPDSTNFKGYSLGLGYKKNISGSLYGFGEINYVSYGNKTTASQGTILNLPASSTTTSKANTTNILIGIGYRF
jgi:opacity protein-like surface antigen